MNRVVLTLLLAVVGVAGSARGQGVAVQARLEKDTFLLYEAIPVTISIRNQTGRTLELNSTGEKTWLDFLVTDEAGRLIKPAGPLPIEENVLVPSGQTLSRRVDLMPLYEVRGRGSFRVQARITQGANQAVSAPASFAIVQGRELWTQSIAMPTATDKDEHRTYSLIAGRSGREELLHVLVRDETKELVYGMVTLGSFLPLVMPEARVDKDGCIHVMYQGAPHSFGYVRIDPLAKPLDRAVYSDQNTTPRLVSNDGVVSVRGGIQTYPRPERIMTEQELNPPPPPPPPPKKKWWWPFGPKATAEN